MNTLHENNLKIPMKRHCLKVQKNIGKGNKLKKKCCVKKIPGAVKKRTR